MWPQGQQFRSSPFKTFARSFFSKLYTKTDRFRAANASLEVIVTDPIYLDQHEWPFNMYKKIDFLYMLKALCIENRVFYTR